MLAEVQGQGYTDGPAGPGKSWWISGVTKEALCGLGLCGCLLIPCAASALTSAALQY